MSRVQDGWHALVLAELGDEQIARTSQDGMARTTFPE